MSDFRIVPGSLGSFLCPPGHPMLKQELREFASPRARTVQGIYGLGYALEHPDRVGESVHKRVKEIYDKAEPVMSELWLRDTYGYFKGCYAPESGSRNTADMVQSGPPERHLGFLMVKEYFPDAEPRLDLIENPGKGYGAYPCTKCGKRVQYEAKSDAWTVVTRRVTGSGTEWFYQPVCTDGRAHEIAD